MFFFLYANQGRVPTETSDSELASDMEPIKPGIQQSLPARMTVNEGDKVRMDCVIVAQPEPEVSLGDDAQSLPFNSF